MIKLWNRDPKKELSKKLTELAKKHGKITKDKDKKKCDEFLEELYKAFGYASENFGKNNWAYTWLGFYCGVCQRVQGGNAKSISLYRKRHTRISLPPISVKTREIGNIKLIQKSYVNVSIKPEIFCSELSQKLEYVRDEILPNVDI